MENPCSNCDSTSMEMCLLIRHCEHFVTKKSKEESRCKDYGLRVLLIRKDSKLIYVDGTKAECLRVLLIRKDSKQTYYPNCAQYRLRVLLSLIHI